MVSDYLITIRYSFLTLTTHCGCYTYVYSGRHLLDVAGACARGEHPDVLKGSSAMMLAQCLLDFLGASTGGSV